MTAHISHSYRQPWWRRHALKLGLGSIVVLGAGFLAAGAWLWTRPADSAASGETARAGLLGLPQLNKVSEAYTEYQVRQYIQRSGKLLDITIPPSATVAKIVNLEDLRSKTPSAADIYDGAQDGDYLILFDTQLVIYRPSANQIIYHGPDPKKIIEDAELTVQKVIQHQAQEAKVLFINPEELPQVQQIADLEGAKVLDAKFFADAKQGDVVATFPENKFKILFRLGLNEIINIEPIRETPGL